MQNYNTGKQLFTLAAAFNLIFAIALFAFPELFVDLLGLGSHPTQPVFVHLFAALVLTFGLGYY